MDWLIEGNFTTMELSVMKQSDSSKAFTNLVFVSPADFATLSAQSPDPAAENQILVEFEGGPKAVGARRHVYAAAADPSVADGGLALSGQQRDDVYVALETKLLVRGHNVRGAPVHTMRLAVELRDDLAKLCDDIKANPAVFECVDQVRQRDHASRCVVCGP